MENRYNKMENWKAQNLWVASSHFHVSEKQGLLYVHASTGDQQEGAGDMGLEMVECLLCKREALDVSQNPS